MGHFPQPGDTFGPYQVTDVVGRGGMGVVFAARQQGLDRTVALKVLAPHLAEQADYRTRFGREATSLARLDSPHVIHVYDHGEVDGCLYLATQYVGGGDLGALVARDGALPVSAALAIAGQVADALDDAQRVGIVHRDVKPSNILLRAGTREPFAYLCDFGIAQTGAEAGGRPATAVTTAGSVPGTISYLSPERCRGEAASVASDIYALGCVLVVMLTGHAPYRGSDVEVGAQHLHGPVPQLPGGDELTHRLNALLRRALAKAPEHRHASPAELRREIDDVAAVARRAGHAPPVAPHLPAGSSGAWSPDGRSPHASGSHGSHGPHGPHSPHGLPPGGPGPTGSSSYAGQRRSRAGAWIAASVAGVVLVAGGVGGALWLAGRDDGSDQAGPSTSSGASTDPADDRTDDPADDATDEPADEPTDDASDRPTGAGGTQPYPPALTAAPADGTLVQQDGFSFRVPQGWQQQDVPNVDTAWVDSTPDGDFAHNVNTVTQTVPPGTTLNEIGIALTTTIDQLGGTDVRFEGIVDLDGVDAAYQAATLRAAGGVEYRVHQFVALHDGRATTMTISQRPDTPVAESQDEIGSILATLTWE